MERKRSETLKLFVVSDVGLRSSLLCSTRSIQGWQSFWPGSDAPSPGAGPWSTKRCRTPATDPVCSRPRWPRPGTDSSDRDCSCGSVREPSSVSSLVPAVLRHSGDRRCFVSRCQIRCKSTAAACCGSGAESAECPAVPLTGSDQSQESDRAVSPGCVFLALGQQLPPHLLTHRTQRIQLLVVKLGPPAYSRFRDLPQPRGTMARRIDLLAATRNGPTAIDRLHPGHDWSEIFGEGQITAHQFFQAAQAVFPVIDGAEMIQAQQLGPAAGVDLVILVAFPPRGILARIAHHPFGDMRFQ